MIIRKLELTTGTQIDEGIPTLFFDIDYEYSITGQEKSFLENTGNVIFERIYIYGFIIGANPAKPNEDLDLRVEAKPIFTARFSNFNPLTTSGDTIFIRSAQRNLKEPSQNIKNALSQLGLDQVRCRLDLTIGQFKYSNAELI